MREVVVTTGSRLHFGLYAIGSSLARQFAGIGMMVDAPGVCVRAERGERDEIVAPAEVLPRVKTFVGRFREVVSPSGPVRLQVSRFIPAHHGLGSGTQLALTVGTALARLSGQTPTAAEIATATGRGVRSAIGIHGFEQGGFIVDAGHAPDGSVGQLADRIPMPAEWRVLLLMPDDCQGLSGASELEAFARLPEMAPELTEGLEECVNSGIVPSLKRGEFDQFASALHEFGQRIGSYFEPAQGGVFRSGFASQLSVELRERGVPAVVQSSWGPTVCVFAPDDQTAQTIDRSLPADLRRMTVRPRNQGATVEVRE